MLRFRLGMWMMVLLVWNSNPCLATPKKHTAAHKHVVKQGKHHVVTHTVHHRHHHKIKKTHHHRVLQANRGSIPDPLPDTSAEATPTPGLVASIEQRLVGFVHKTVDTLRYSVYKLGGSHFDTSHGVYILDCSNYVDHVLEKTSPHAYSSLVNTSGIDQPTTLQYYDFFNKLSSTPQHDWNKVDEVGNLEPGDILVFRNKSETSGHVMIIMKKPTRDANDFFVRVADSAPAGHSQDTRPSHVSGIGIGTLQLKVNPKTGQPSAYAWKIGSHWKHNVHFAMARPLDMHLSPLTPFSINDEKSMDSDG